MTEQYLVLVKFVVVQHGCAISLLEVVSSGLEQCSTFTASYILYRCHLSEVQARVIEAYKCWGTVVTIHEDLLGMGIMNKKADV